MGWICAHRGRRTQVHGHGDQLEHLGAGRFDSALLQVGTQSLAKGGTLEYNADNRPPLVLAPYRLAYQLDGTSGDFTRAAQAFISNGTWVNAAAGSG